MRRRDGLGLLLAAACASAWAAERDDAIRRGRHLRFPEDHGAHPGARTEWWYLTGHLHAPGAAADAPPRWGFQITFFRSRTGLAATLPGRFAPRQLLFAHAALTDLGVPGQPGRHVHVQRIARWNGVDATPRAHTALGDTDLALGGWTLRRQPADGGYAAWLAADAFALDLQLQPTQALLLQGEQGFSQKGPQAEHASHYLSQPQLAVSGRLGQGGAAPVAVQGRAWLDHEWSDSLMAPGTVGWDWVGINLFDGSALTAFRLRGQGDAPPVWAGGSFRDAQGRTTVFGPTDVRFEPGRRWTSPATAATYPVQWTLLTPAGQFTLNALLDAQELDSRASTGTVYWEGLSALADTAGRQIGLGYLEMTGYAGRLAL
jgi:predicted secreted hydrolase